MSLIFELSVFVFVNFGYDLNKFLLSFLQKENKPKRKKNQDKKTINNNNKMFEKLKQQIKTTIKQIMFVVKIDDLISSVKCISS